MATQTNLQCLGVEYKQCFSANAKIITMLNYLMRSREVGQSRQTHYLKNGGSNPPSATSRIVIMAHPFMTVRKDEQKALTAIFSNILLAIRVIDRALFYGRLVQLVRTLGC